MLATTMKPHPNPNHEQRIVNVRFASSREDIEQKFAQVFGLFRLMRQSEAHNMFLECRTLQETIHNMFVHVQLLHLFQ